MKPKNEAKIRRVLKEGRKEERSKKAERIKEERGKDD